MTKRILQTIKLDKIAAVDNPCQEGAIVSIMKRAPTPDVLDEAIAKRVEDLRNTIVGATYVVNTLLAKREFSDKERAAAADKGEAMPGGGFPIKNKSDLSNAVQAIGRAKNRAATMAHIKTRARALGVSDSLPDTWEKRLAKWDESQHPRVANGEFGTGSGRQFTTSGEEPKGHLVLRETGSGNQLHIPLTDEQAKQLSNMQAELDNADRASLRRYGQWLLGLSVGYTLLVPAPSIAPVIAAIGGALWFFNRKSKDTPLEKAALDVDSIMDQVLKETGVKANPKVWQQAKAYLKKNPKLLTDKSYLIGQAKRIKGVKKGGKLNKQGYYARMKHPDGSLKHFECNTSNRQVARARALATHPGHSIIQMHEKNLKKAWTDESRHASAEARQRHSAAATKMANNFKDEAARQSSPAMKDAHLQISRQYKLAASHFDIGNTQKGFHHFQMADDMYGHPSVYLSDLRDGKIGKQRLPGGKATPNPMLIDRNEGARRGKQAPRSARQLQVSPMTINKTKRLFPDLKSVRTKSGLKGGRNPADVYAQSDRLRGESGTNRKPMLMEKFQPRLNRQQRILVKLNHVVDRAVAAKQDSVEIMRKVIGNTAADYIHDFVNSDNPKFKGKSKQDRIKQALGAYYGNK